MNIRLPGARFVRRSFTLGPMDRPIHHRPIHELSRRELLALISAVGVGAALGIPGATAAAAPAPAGLPRLTPGLLNRAAATMPAGSDLGAVEHVIFLMMENRSYDHYFGAYHKGRGFDDHPKHSRRV
jgi:phospholipase C